MARTQKTQKSTETSKTNKNEIASEYYKLEFQSFCCDFY